MLNAIIKFSLQNRLIVVAAASLLLVWGSYVAINLPVGEVVLVDLPNSLKGNTISFACGMGMMKGKILVK